MTKERQFESAAGLVRIQAAALAALAERLDGPMQAAMESAVAVVSGALDRGARVIVTGIGKSGHIARKIAATMVSTGTAAQFLHPAEATHGDLGMLGAGDVVLVLSYSGETEELLRILPALAGGGRVVVAVCGCVESTLAREARILLDASVDREACPLNLAPTASTTVMLALCDALALEVSRRRGFAPQHFADLHPGGKLGRRLARVRDLMHAGEALPAVTAATPMPQVIYEMSRKKLGMTTVLDTDGKLLGVISDGDLRRLLEREGGDAVAHTAGEVMHANPLTTVGGAFASAALVAMEERKITSLVVVSEEQMALGVVHLHDLLALDLG